jgi:hypothetical protein
MSGMKRRTFIVLLGAASLASPFAARAQQPTMPVIGVLSTMPARKNAEGPWVVKPT